MRVEILFLFSLCSFVSYWFSNVKCLQVFYELLRLIKVDKERRHKPQENSSNPAATHTTKRSSMTSRRNGGVKSVPAGRNSTKRAKKKKQRKKSLVRRIGRRSGVRNFRRRMRRVWRRIVMCRVMWRHPVWSRPYYSRKTKTEVETIKNTAPCMQYVQAVVNCVWTTRNIFVLNSLVLIIEYWTL